MRSRFQAPIGVRIYRDVVWYLKRFVEIIPDIFAGVAAVLIPFLLGVVFMLVVG